MTKLDVRKVIGSSPISSTKKKPIQTDGFFFFNYSPRTGAIARKSQCDLNMIPITAMYLYQLPFRMC